MVIDVDEALDEENMIINETDGLPSLNHYKSETEYAQSREPSTVEELLNDEDLPTSLIVTNLSSDVFKSDTLKQKIEEIFTRFGEPVSFHYFRSFRRMRVDYGCSAAAAKARIHLHQTRFGDNIINCYFAQPVTPIDVADRHLQLPAPVKQFLISPPASPPLGWEPREENEPLVNYDLIAAIANLTPGKMHELHAASSTQPGIVVHVCEDGLSSQATDKQRKPQILPTSCPKYN